jgi:hypothetical protein
LIGKRHNPYVNDLFECILFVGSGGLDLFLLYVLRSFARSSGNPSNNNNYSDEQKGRTMSSNNSSIVKLFGKIFSIASVPNGIILKKIKIKF